MRQRRRQRGQEEPVDAEYQQHRHVERHPAVAQGHEYRSRRHERGPEQGRPDQDLAPRPAVDEYPGERADQRVRQVKDREGSRASRGARERGGVEEHVRPDPGGDDTVAGLRDQPGGEETAEIPLGEHRAQIAEERRLGPVGPVIRRTGSGGLRDVRAASYDARVIVPTAHPSSLGFARQRATSPRMNFSTRSRQTSSPNCSGGDFMK